MNPAKFAELNLHGAPPEMPATKYFFATTALTERNAGFAKSTHDGYCKGSEMKTLDLLPRIRRNSTYLRPRPGGKGATDKQTQYGKRRTGYEQ